MSPRARSIAGLVAGLVVGVGLAATPFLRYRLGAPHRTAHMDHQPRHGGLLAMVGDHHLEVRRDGDDVQVWPSDAHRRPLRSRGGWLELLDGAHRPLVPDATGELLRGEAGGGPITCHVQISDDEVARLDVP